MTVTTSKKTLQQIDDRRTKAESAGAVGANSTLSNDFNMLLFGDVFTDGVNYEDTAGEQDTFDGYIGSEIEQTTAANEGAEKDAAVSDELQAGVDSVSIEDVFLQYEGTKSDNSNDEDEATVIKGVAFNVDTTSVICSSGNLATHGDEFEAESNQIKQVIEFDYDLTLQSGSDFDATLKDFESSLLSYLGYALESSGCVLGTRQLQQQTAQSVVLQKMSSTPEDSLNQRAVCNESMISVYDSSECYPIKGYVTSYYSGDSTMEDQVAQSIRGLIAKGMSSKSITSDSVLETNFIKSRTTTEINMLARSEPQAESKSIASVIGMFGVGLVAVVVVGLSVFMLKRKYENGGAKKSGAMPSEVENAIQLDISDDDPHDIDAQQSFYGNSISSASTELVSNRRPRPKPTVNPLYLEEGAILEETLSEDEAEDALPSFHPDCMCLGN